MQQQAYSYSLPQTKKIPLFDGAMSINLDNNWVDISELTQVPDNQIVFGHKLTDQSIIIEILEREHSVDNLQAGTFFFTDLAHANECCAGEFDISEQKDVTAKNFQNLKENYFQKIVYGEQKVAHAREKAKNSVFVGMYVLRLEKYNAEVLITFNDPKKLVGGAAQNAIVVHDPVKAKQFFEQLIDTFKIEDYSIFGQ